MEIWTHDCKAQAGIAFTTYLDECGKCGMKKPAIPPSTVCKPSVEQSVSVKLKELRDEFAMAALTGLLGNPDTKPTDGRSYQMIADEAYIQADAMMEARDAN